MDGFRVKLDLSAYFVDYRRNSWVFIDPKHIKSVKDLKHHICKIFCIGSDFEIFICGDYVPDTECVNIIIEGDVLEIKSALSQQNTSTPLKEGSTCKKNKKVGHDISGADEEVVPERKSVRRSKRRNAEGKGRGAEEVAGTVEVVSPQENFMPECTSIVAPRKKKKSSNEHVALDASVRSLIDEVSEDVSKSDKGRKQVDGREEMEEACIASRENDKGVERFSPIKTETEITIGGNKIKENGSSLKTKYSKGGHSDLKATGDAVETFSTAIAVTVGDCNSDTISFKSPLFQQNMLESTVNNRVLDVSRCVNNELGAKSESRKRRSRPRRRKYKTEPTNVAGYNLITLSKVEPSRYLIPYLQSHINKKTDTSKVKLHLRFSDSEDGEENNAIQTEIFKVIEEGKGITMGGLNESKSIFDDSKKADVKIVKACEVEVNMAIEDEIVKEMEVKGNRKEEDSFKDAGKSAVGIADQQEIPEDDTVMVRTDMTSKQNAEEERMHDCSSEENINSKVRASELMSPTTGCSVTSRRLHCRTKNRTRNAVISMGLGGTLAHLMRECKTVGEGDLQNKSCPDQPIAPNIPHAKPVVLSSQLQKNENYRRFPILEKYPRKGDILAFKILKLNEKYEPCVSDYLEGIVTICDKEKSRVAVKILEGANELKRNTGKFDLQLEEEDEETASKRDDVTMQLAWKEFIEPRLVFP